MNAHLHMTLRRGKTNRFSHAYIRDSNKAYTDAACAISACEAIAVSRQHDRIEK
jgi:hypothetical protein